MPLNDAILNVGVTAMQAQITHLAIHTALPDAAGSNQSTAIRVATGWGAAANGDFATLVNKVFTGGAPNGPALYVGYWNGGTVGAGTYYGSQALVGDQVFSSAGEYTIPTFTLTGSAIG